MAILNQLQVAEVFKHVLLMSSNSDGKTYAHTYISCTHNCFDVVAMQCGIKFPFLEGLPVQCTCYEEASVNFVGSPRYDCHLTSESLFLKLLAFCTCLVNVMGCGLQSYNLPRYKQLNKRIGRMIRYARQHKQTAPIAKLHKLLHGKHKKLL